MPIIEHLVLVCHQYCCILSKYSSSLKSSNLGGQSWLLVEVLPTDHDPPNCCQFTSFLAWGARLVRPFSPRAPLLKETGRALLLMHWRILTSLSVSHSGDSLPSYWCGHSSEQFARKEMVGVIPAMINSMTARSFWKIDRTIRMYCNEAALKTFL